MTGDNVFKNIDGGTAYLLGDGVSNIKAADLGVIPEDACTGVMSFRKITTGDEVYVALKGITPDGVQQSYHIILTDDIPAFILPGIVKGVVKAVGNAATSKIHYVAFYS